jgi:hypothetical protein
MARSPSALVVVFFTLTAAIVASAASAVAAPSPDELAARKRALDQKLAHQGFTVVVEPPFVVIGDEAPGVVKHHASGILRWSIRLLEAEYFKTQPDKLIEIWLFRDKTSYMKGAKKFFDDTPDTPYGYYSSVHDAMVMNIGLGAGTLVHEIVHPYIEANFPAAPSWFNEGLASMYERPSERKGHIIGKINWRLPNLKGEIKAGSLPAMTTLLSTTTPQFYAAEFDAYAYARYLLFYLQEHGKLTALYTKFVADTDDHTGKAALEAVLGEKLETFEPTWRAWVTALREDNH